LKIHDPEDLDLIGLEYQLEDLTSLSAEATTQLAKLTF
jgi:hypothetical protein